MFVVTHLICTQTANNNANKLKVEGVNKICEYVAMLDVQKNIWKVKKKKNLETGLKISSLKNINSINDLVFYMQFAAEK